MSKKSKISKTERKTQNSLQLSDFSVSLNPSARSVSKDIKIKDRDKKHSSKEWIMRQQKDQFVKKSILDGYRSRAAYKLLEIDRKFSLIKNARRILDLGAAPGGWSQVIAKKKPRFAKFAGLDLLEMDQIDTMDFYQGDFCDKELQKKLIEKYNKFDLIICDIAPNTTGIKSVDSIQLSVILEEVMDFCKQCLLENGNLVIKVFGGGGEVVIEKEAKALFDKLKYFKPASSRKESKEFYMICLGFNSTKNSKPLSELKNFANSQGNEKCGADLPLGVTSTVNDKIDDESL